MTSWTRQLRRWWLLGAYVLVTFTGGLALEMRPTWTHLVNYAVLLPLYLGIIAWWTRRDTPLEAAEIGRPERWREVIALVVPWVVIIALTAWVLVVRAKPSAPVTLTSTPQVVASATEVDHAHLLWMRMGNALSSTIKQTLPALALCLLARMSWRRMGFAPRHLGLAGALAAVGMTISIVLAWTTDAPLAQLPLYAFPAIVVPYYAIQLLINALPEELAARGLILQRWLALTGSPSTAITVATVWFAAMHAPYLLLQDGDLTLAQSLRWLFFAGQPTGIVWGYIMYRTRSLWPGILWHASYTVLGHVFL